MIPITDATKTALHQAVKQVRAQISWATSADTTETITSEDKLISMKKEAEGYYCKSTLRKITVVLTGTDTNLLDRRITALVQVKTGANTWGSISWGSFTITEAQVDETKGTSTFVGYGGIAMLQKQEYVAGELTFPTTVGGLLKQVADKFALTVDPSVVILPEEYQRVEYLQGDGSAYLSIDYYATSKTKVEAEIEPISIPVDTTYAQTGVYGEWESGKVYRTYWSNSETPYWSITPGTATGFVQLQKQYIMQDAANGKLIVNGNEYTFTPEANWTSATQFKIFRADVGSNHYSANMKLYYFKIYDNGELRRDLVPCKRKSDNTPGLYDRVTGAFYTNAGSGSFTAGNATASPPNLDAPITEDLWAKITGTTYRDILEEIAGATGTIAVIGRGDDILNLELPPVSEASETLTEDNLITAKIGENWGRVSAVVLSRQPQGDNVEVVDQATADLPTGKNLFNNNATPILKNTDATIEATPTGVKMTQLTTPTAGTSSYRVEVIVLGNTNEHIGEYLTLKTNITKSGGVKPKVNIGTCDSDGNNRSTKTATSQGATGEQILSWQITEDQTRPLLIVWLYIDSTSSTQMQAGDTVEFQDLQVEFTNDGIPTAYEPCVPNGRVDLVIANNEIMDKQRETTATPILEAVKGWDYRNAEIKTEGHGYHEIGDRLDLTVAGETYPVVVTKSSITIDGGIKEVLTSATPEVIPIDYAKSGGITKTVFRTELVVDKQAQQIDSIVSRQDATDAAVAEQFTQITQNLTEIVATAQASGGGNFIRNSVGFGKENDGTLTIWQYGTGATTTTVRSQSAPASLSAGAVSGHEIQMTGASAISQEIALTPGETYTLALRAKKNTAGAVTISVANTSNSATITLANGTAYKWQQQKVEFVPVASTNTVTITVPSGASVEITDLILTSGGAYTWRQASGEIYNAQVSLDQAGVQVRSSVYTGDYVEITPLEFSGWSNASGTMKKVFTLNRETTEVEQLEARSQIKMPPIKIVPINNSSYKGWAFVKEG